MKLFSIPGGTGRFSPFDQLPFTDFLSVTDPDDINDDDRGALVVWGGGDISPTIYGKHVSRRCNAGVNLSRQDGIEVALAKRAIQLGMPIIGVCRGAQLLCGLAGGHLIQHVDNHGGSHKVVTKEGTLINTNSIHHQMMYPFDVKHELRAWIEEHRSAVHIDVDEQGNDINNKPPVEPEYVYFPEIKGYAIQWHPEFMDAHCETNQWLLKDLQQGLFHHD